MFFTKRDKRFMKQCMKLTLQCPKCRMMPLLSLYRNRPYLIQIDCTCLYHQIQTLRDFFFEQFQLNYEQKFKTCSNKDCNSNQDITICQHCNQWFCTSCLQIHIMEEDLSLNKCPFWHRENEQVFFCNNCQKEMCEKCASNCENQNHFTVNVEAIFPVKSHVLNYAKDALALQFVHRKKNIRYYSHYIINAYLYYLSILVYNNIENNQKSWNAKMNASIFCTQLNYNIIISPITEHDKMFVLDFPMKTKDKITNYQSIHYHKKMITYMILIKSGRIVSCSLDMSIKIIDSNSKFEVYSIDNAHKQKILFLCEIEENCVASLAEKEIKIWKLGDISYELLFTIREITRSTVMTKITKNRFAYNSYGKIIIRKSVSTFDIIHTIQTDNKHIYSMLELKDKHILAATDKLNLLFFDLNNYSIKATIPRITSKGQTGIIELENNRLLVVSIKFGGFYIINTKSFQKETTCSIPYLMYYPVYNKIDYNEDNKQLIGKAIYFSHCIKLKDKRIMIITNSGGINIYETIGYSLKAQFIEFSLFYMYSLIKLTDNQFSMANDDTGAITFFDYIPNK